MRFYGEQTGLKNRFRAVDTLGDFAEAAKAISAPGAQQSDKQFAIEQAAKIVKEHDDIQHGLKSGSIESVHLTTAAASKEAQGSAQENSERKAKEQYEDAMFLALLNSGDLDAYVAENIFGGMSDAEVTDVISMIEAETGRKFEEYAENFLGDDMPERVPGESDADYHRRVLIAVTDEVLNDDLTIKAGYENDPLARFVNNHEVTQHAREKTREADQIALREGADAGIAHIKDEVEGNYAVARVVSDESEVSEVSDFGGGTQDNHSDASFNDASSVEKSSSFFSGFPGSDGALETAKADFETQFPKAAAPKTAELASTAEHTVKVEIGRDLT
ncbi:hypothetical protein [uncultured Roseibium sp.]|uniref:hypothetical protein n=1 Tax=uncultured Roseibium sp. TaxID=1936171 RepID=UPI00261C7260|nr:hypothetical protein [uncultured Roseibium sp.]